MASHDAERENSNKDKALTEFGATVLSLMAEKGVRSQTRLVAMLDGEGNSISQPGFSNWLRGGRPAKWFPGRFARVLELNEQQKGRLAYAFAYGQTKHVEERRP